MSRSIALALKKQRLQFESAALRQALARDMGGLVPIAIGIDRVRNGLAWLKERPRIAVAASVALLVARPRAAFRWLRRGFFAFRAWRALRSRMGH